MKVKIFAKINLTLDVVGVKDGYHLINSFMSPINLFDVVKVKKRKDYAVTVKEVGILSGAKEEDNNAYKTAKAFMEEFNVKGVDIVIDKGIFVGGGLGGSSADIAGVLIAMKKLYGIKESILPLANRLGCDVAFMLQGRQAVVSGRGERLTTIGKKAKLKGVLIYSGESLSAKEAYSSFDERKEKFAFATEKVIDKIEKGDKSFVYDLSNHLEKSVTTLLPVVKENIEELKITGACNALMTGSGSAVYGIFNNRKELIKAYEKLKKKHGQNVKIIKTL